MSTSSPGDSRDPSDGEEVEDFAPTEPADLDDDDASSRQGGDPASGGA